MRGHEIVENFRTRKKWSGSVGAVFLLSADADALLDYIEILERKFDELSKAVEDSSGPGHAAP